jgi:hypothetical protein
MGSATFGSVATDSSNSFSPGPSASDRITNDNTLTLSGTWTSTSNSEKYLGIFIRPVGSSGPWQYLGLAANNVSPGSGSWSLNTGVLADGQYNVLYKWAANAGQAANSAGGTVVTNTFTVDTNDPDVSFDSGDTSLNLSDLATSQTYTFTTEPGAQVTVTFTGPGGSVSDTVFADGSGIATVTLSPTQLASLGFGTVDITATAEDVAGNVFPVTTVQTIAIVCFLAGTRIATPKGHVPVETLKPGDLVLTADGRAVPVRFLGRQTVHARFAPPERANPIRISAGALGENLPARDLFLSRNHAIALDGVLATASALVNGTTIQEVPPPAEVFEYFSIETEKHEIILAEGCPVEIFMDHVPRSCWHNYRDYVALYGAGRPIAELPLPHAKSWRQLPRRLRARIAERTAILCGAAQEAA